MSAQSSPEGPLPAKDSQLLFAAGESPTVEAGMQARRAALLNLNESYDGLGDTMATDPTEIPVDFLRAQPLLAVQMAALVVAPGRMQEVVRVASSRTKEFPTAADAIDELIRIMQEEVIEQLLELQEAGQQAAAQERSSGKTGAQRLSSQVEKGPVAGSLEYLTPSSKCCCFGRRPLTRSGGSWRSTRRSWPSSSRGWRS